MGGQNEGYFLSYKTLGAIGTLVAILVALGGSVTQVSSWEYRITTLETSIETSGKADENLSNEMKILSSKMGDLTLLLKEVQVKQELGTR